MKNSKILFIACLLVFSACKEKKVSEPETYPDWWQCVNTCQDLACIEKCAEAFNEKHYKQNIIKDGTLKLRLRKEGEESPDYPTGAIYGCPRGYHYVPWCKPVYDDEGLFITGCVTVYYCVPDDYVPVG